MDGASRGGNPSVPVQGMLAAALLSLFAGSPGEAAVVGLVTDTAAHRVAVFDADNDRVSALHSATPGNAIGDCAVSASHQLGITTNSSSRLSFIDLAEQPVAPMEMDISNLGVDMTLNAGGQFLVASGGGALQQPLSVVDLHRRVEVAVSSPFVDHSSVEFCDDDTLLITTSRGRRYVGPRDNALYTATLGVDADVVLRGERLSSGAQPNNSACAPGSRSGVLLDRAGGITSFTLPGMDLAERRATAGGMGLSADFSTDGRRLYVRTEQGVDAFDFDPASGAMLPAWSRHAPTVSTYYGMEQLAVHPAGDKLYVDGGDALLVLLTSDGSLISSIAAADATGVCLAGLGPAREYHSAVGNLEDVAAP